ncbi:MAG: nuclear transport factor 2 family protein [Candidatus Marinimicrobia bacterium]|nr:nuclear transport factor 2 family protein [Candidatus Neomarinimicrobiota bacterium]
MKKIIITLIVLSVAIPTTLIAGDKEDIVKQIKQQWVDFSNKTVDMSTLHPDGTWQGTSQGGLWEFLSPNEVRAQIEESPNAFNFRPHHIEVTIVGRSKDVAFTNYYLVGNITGPNGKVLASNYRTRASGTMVKKGGKWVSVGQHFSPLYGGSGVIFD